MFIYNVTVKVEWPVHESWVAWIQQEHMQEVVDTGCFYKSQLLRLLDQDDDEGPTYSVQYFAESRSDYQRYIDDHATLMRQKVYDKWGDQVIAFRSLMQIVS